MKRSLTLTLVLGCSWVGQAAAQETPSAAATRKKLQQKLTLDFNMEGNKAIFDFIKGEMDKPVSFKLDNASGVSNNAKMSYKCKDKTVEDILNDLCATGDFGWFVKSDVKDRLDGWVIIRKFKEKERGYEGGGTEPKKKAALDTRTAWDSALASLVTIERGQRELLQMVLQLEAASHERPLRMLRGSKPE